MSKILIIEDEKNLARFVELELKHEGYETEVHFNGRTGLEAALAEDWDAILLDLMLPELNGLEVCRRVRQVKNTPIIMMTARDSVIDRVSGLDHGADDYIVKRLPSRSCWHGYAPYYVELVLKAKTTLPSKRPSSTAILSSKRKTALCGVR